MAIDPERVKTLFLKAIEHEDPGGRQAVLEAEAGDDPELLDRVIALLAAYDQPPGPLDRPLGADREVTNVFGDPRPIAPTPSKTIADDRPAVDLPDDDGPNVIDTIIAERYKIRQEIGEGGMGTVFLAEQLRPVRRQVALKLIKRGMDSRNVLARFESERQALALMEHPNIARVLDAGTTTDGRPFFVMELVKGIPITEYCDAHRLDLHARLELFRQVCSAVQHAHQKGIIHRDLKPSNILVEAHDNRPVPKVIDFGLAKATSGMRLTDQSLFTAFGSVAGTPLYMAPEQASFNALDIDTRADIYALGVILYELLAGSTPIARESFRQAALDEMLRMIREVEPPTPSNRVSTSEALPSLAANRHIEPARLSRLIRGDLDWIVMKALAKERERRYASAVGLADDLERYLNHEPVTAGPPTAAYRLRKFVRRNRIQVAASAVVLLALLLGVIGTTLGLFEARRQERRAVTEANAREAARAAEAEQRQIAEEQRSRAEARLGQVTKMNEILGSIFQDLNPANAAKDGKPLSAVLGERLDRATAEIEGDAIGDPLAVARMQMTLGMSQHRLGYPDRAIALFTRARTTFATELGPYHPTTLASMNNLANSFADAGQNGRALELREETLALQKSKLGLDHPDTLGTMNNLANGYGAAGQNDRALKLREETLALRKAKLGPDHPDTLRSMNNLALSYRAAGQSDRALKLNEGTLALMKAKLGPEHPDTLRSMNNLSLSYADTGQNDRALKLREETLARQKAKLGPDHPDTLRSMANLAISYYDTGQNDRAIKLYEETLALKKSKLGPDHPETLRSMYNLAGSYHATGQTDRALKLREQTLALRKAKLGPEHPDTLKSLKDLAQSLQEMGQYDRAEPLWDTLVETQGRLRGADHADTLAARLDRVDLDLDRKRYDVAEPVYRSLLTACRAKLGPDHANTLWAESNLTSLYERRGDCASAVPLLRVAVDRARKDTANRVELGNALVRLSKALHELKQWPEAEAADREALAIREADQPDAWNTFNTRANLGAALLGQGRTSEAGPLLRSGYEGMAQRADKIPPAGKPRLAEALDALIAAGDAAGTKAELATWKAERAKLATGGPKP